MRTLSCLQLCGQQTHAHLRYLPKVLNIKWQEKVPNSNTEVLGMAELPII